MAEGTTIGDMDSEAFLGVELVGGVAEWGSVSAATSSTQGRPSVA
jgi:hypothetical protein